MINRCTGKVGSGLTWQQVELQITSAASPAGYSLGSDLNEKFNEITCVKL